MVSDEQHLHTITFSMLLISFFIRPGCGFLDWRAVSGPASQKNANGLICGLPAHGSSSRHPAGGLIRWLLSNGSSSRHPAIGFSRWRSGLQLSLMLSVLLFSSCAPTEELKDDEMEQLLAQAFEEYSDFTAQLEEIDVDYEELDESTIMRLEERADMLLEELPALAVNLEMYRSRLADLKAGLHNEIPETYLDPEKPEEEEEQRFRDRGFRIQIISTQDARFADEIREDFEEWIRSVSTPPLPRTYMVFQQPFYRVHIGDFLSRERAMEFTDFVRLRYPDAWVVHSQVIPSRVER